jgi:hypothetical protein
MSRYDKTLFRFDGLRTIPLAERGGKVKADDFARAHTPGAGLSAWLESLPRILAGDDLRALVERMHEARAKRKPILWGMGGHVIKCGLAPVLIDLMRRGYATGFLMNGSTSIHDFEIALSGATSEDVESVLPGGQFGMARETGEQWNQAIARASQTGAGIGEALGEHLQDTPYAGASLLSQAWAARTPVTVHLAIGTDTPHMHPQADGGALGQASHNDFRLACTLISELGDGGVYLNVGSAVVLPEVFLKCVSVVRNLGTPLLNFTTANFDFLQHYRPRANVVQRPHAQAGGRGFAFTGHHELMIPLLAALLIETQPAP